jgi:cytoskeletal protein CcmA (bactofilin family)
MFNRDAVPGNKAEKAGSDERAVNRMPGLAGAGQARPDGTGTSHAEPRKVEQSSDAVSNPGRGWEEHKGSQLVVGADIKLKGLEITDCDTLFVEGRVEASLESRVVKIAESGVFAGCALMEVAEIWGRFDGQLTARKHLLIHATGRVSGIVRYGSIRIEEGGQLTGDVDTLTGADSVGGLAPSEPSISPLKLKTYQPVAASTPHAAQAGASTV